MLKQMMLVTTVAGLSACGGSNSGSSGGETDLSSEENNYLSYMKAAYTDQVGERSSPDSTGNCIACLENAPMASDNGAEADFSGTNVQIDGVDEADSLKFDGNHLLALNEQYSHSYNPLEDDFTVKVRAFSEAVLAGDEEENSDLHFEPDNTYQYSGILSYNEQAVLVGSSNYWFGSHPFEPIISTIDIACFSNCSPESNTIAYIWQYAQAATPLIPDPEQIKIEGSLIETRLIEDKLYIISQYNPRIENLYPYPSTEEERSENQEGINQLELSDITPKIEIDGTSALLFDGEDCEISTQEEDYYNYPNVISITAIDINAPTNWTSTCFVGNVSNAFVSLNSVYLSQWDWADNQVEIVKYALTDTGPEYRAKGSVDGSLSYDSYFFSEVDGKLAYVNTIYDQNEWWSREDGRHQLTILEENGNQLDIAAQIPNENQPAPIGKPGELIYAVRFLGDRAYIVTFDKVDPLYVIDLSDPINPEILGELEIPGFSSYLHVINDDLILGVGKNAVSENGTTWYQGLNIRLFDIRDPNNPVAIESLDYGLRGSHSEVFENPHAFSFVHNSDSNLFRFTLPMQLHGSMDEFQPDIPANTSYEWSEGGLFQFEVTTGTDPELQEVGRYTTSAPDDYWYYKSDDRSVINDDIIYYSHNGIIDVIEWSSDSSLRSFDNN